MHLYFVMSRKGRCTPLREDKTMWNDPYEKGKTCYLCGKKIPPMDTRFYVLVPREDERIAYISKVPEEICVFCEVRIHGKKP